MDYPRRFKFVYKAIYVYLCVACLCIWFSLYILITLKKIPFGGTTKTILSHFAALFVYFWTMWLCFSEDRNTFLTTKAGIEIPRFFERICMRERLRCWCTMYTICVWHWFSWSYCFDGTAKLKLFILDLQTCIRKLG